MTINNFVNILLIEDNEGDIELTREAFEEGKILNHLTAVQTAEEALDLLNQRNGHEEAVRPDLILLDLNLPSMSGHDFLEEIGKNEILADIPVVILSSSVADKDILRSYDLNAVCYMVKPLETKKLFDIISELDSFEIGIICKKAG